jgi:putative toxin-antitoxin system antitoxin component (TIGR02293 family)
MVYVSLLHKQTGMAKTSQPNVAQVIQGLRDGLPLECVERAQILLGLSRESIAELMHTSPRTLARRKVLAQGESERLFRVVELFQRACEVLGDVVEARRWFSSPKKAFNGNTPLSYAQSELGAREVEDLLGRLEHGVFA